jgi:hypothetical protein
VRVPDQNLAEVFDRGFTVVEGFLDRETLAAAQDALWEIYPRPADYFAAPEAHAQFSRSQFRGIRIFPYLQPALNRLATHPDLVEAAERFCDSRELDLYKIELWAKYAGAINYDQHLHRDYGNHTLMVPRADQVGMQMTTFILLSDVGEHDGPTKLVPLEKTRHIPLGVRDLPFGELIEDEVAAVAPAGSLMIYKPDVFHRGSNFTAPGRSRFALLVDFKARNDWRWQGKLHWADHANRPGWAEAMAAMTPRERDLFGWPPPGSDYWNAQTLSDTALRYPSVDVTPYGAAAPAAEANA